MLKKIMYIGFGIQLSAVIYAIICVFMDTSISSIVTVIMIVGLLINMIASSLLRKELRKNNEYDEKNIKMIDKKRLIFLLVLIVSFIFLSLISTIYLPIF